MIIVSVSSPLQCQGSKSCTCKGPADWAYGRFDKPMPQCLCAANSWHFESSPATLCDRYRPRDFLPLLISAMGGVVLRIDDRAEELHEILIAAGLRRAIAGEEVEDVVCSLAGQAEALDECPQLV